MAGVGGRLIGEGAERILPLAGKATSPTPLALPAGQASRSLEDNITRAMYDVGRPAKDEYPAQFDPFAKESEIIPTDTGVRIGDPAFPLELNTLPVRDYDPVVHKVRIFKGQAVEEAMPANLGDMKTWDIIELSGTGFGKRKRYLEIFPDGSLVRFKGNRPFVETTMKKVKRYGAEVLEFTNQWSNEQLTKTGKRARPGQMGSLQMRAATEKSERARMIPREFPGDPGQMTVASQGRAVTLAQMQREELGPLGRMIGYTADDFVDLLINSSVPGDINWGRLNARGKLGITQAIRSKRHKEFKEKGAVLWETGFQALHRPLMSSSRNRFLDTRQKKILRAFDGMASDLGTYETNERLMLSLLDMMPDEMVDRLAVSVKKDMPDASAHYSSHPAAGIMTLTLSQSDAHTFFHEFMHHIQTFIAPEDLDGLAMQFKRALMAEDTQGLISTLYYSAHTRIKNEAHLRELIRADPDILRAWTEMLGGQIRTLSGQPSTMGRRAPTEADLNAIIAIMQDEGKLPPSFTQAANPSFDIEKYGPWKTDGSTTLGGMFPQEYEIDQLRSMLYRYTNFNEYLAEVFSDRMLVNAAAKMLKDEKWLSLFDRIIDLLTDWFIGAHNWAKRHGRKDLVDDIIKRIQRGDFNSVTYDKAQRELERPYESWRMETGAGGRSVVGTAAGEVVSGMGGPKRSVFDMLGRIREIEGGEQGGGAFAQSQPPAQAGSIGVATPEERAQMNAYLKKAQEKWGVGPLGNRRLGDAGQELQAPYQPFPVEKTETFLREPMGTVGQEFRTGRLEDPIISKRGLEGVSPDMSQRFGGIFSTLNKRDFNYIEEVLRDRPFWFSSVKRPGIGSSYDDIDLNNMSNRHILNLLDELKRRARFFIDKRTGLKFLDEASTEKGRVDSAEFRRDQRELLANVNKIREKLASAMKKQGQDTSDITNPWAETLEANKHRWAAGVNRGETDIWPDLAEEFGIEVSGRSNEPLKDAPNPPMVPFGAGDEGMEGMSGPFAAGVARMWDWYRRMEQEVAEQVRNGKLTASQADREMELIIRERDQEIENLKRETGGGTWADLDREIERRVKRAENMRREWQEEVFVKMNEGKITGEAAARELREIEKDFQGELDIIRRELGSRPEGNIKYTDPDTDSWSRGQP